MTTTTSAAEIGRELRNLYVAGPRTQALWDSCDDIITATENLTYLQELAAGDLDARAFTNYLIQDEIYLDGYARTMLLLGHRAANNEDMRFWATSAGTAGASMPRTATGGRDDGPTVHPASSAERHSSPAMTPRDPVMTGRACRRAGVAAVKVGQR